MTDELFELVTRTPGVCGGEPCLAGTRITMFHFEELLREGMNLDQIAAAYPHLDPGKLKRAMDRWFFFKNYWSGICLCGHTWERHHLSMVARKEFTDLLNEGAMPGACLAFGCNEREGLDEKDELHCFGYVDKDHPDPSHKACWKGTKRH